VAEGVHARGMRLRLVIPVLAALGLTVLTVPMSYGFAAEYGAIDGGPLAYFGIGLYIFWPVVVLVGALAGGVPYRLGERRAALPAGIALALVSVVGIGVAGALGTRAKAAQYPTSPACVADEDATPEEVEAVEELEEALAAIDHPVRFEALSAEASTTARTRSPAARAPTTGSSPTRPSWRRRAGRWTPPMSRRTSSSSRPVVTSGSGSSSTIPVPEG
jgi:hypothetical protein